MANYNPNSTNYVHSSEPNTEDLVKAMDYNSLGQPVVRTVSSSAYIGAGNLNTSSDAFGRMRFSQPLTLFDSSHRYADNGLFAEDTTGTASSTFNADQGLIDLDVGSSSGDEILRETNKTFAYQPGKSLLVLSSFLLATAKTNLRQRVGYFGSKFFTCYSKN